MRVVSILLSIFFLTGCLGGAGGLSDSEMRELEARIDLFYDRYNDFVADTNTNGQYQVTKLKSSTEHGFWWAVVFDQNTQTNIAVNLGNYDVNMDINEFWNNSANFFTGLVAYPGHYEYFDIWEEDCTCYRTESKWIETVYIHGPSGAVFEKTQPRMKDLETMAALQEEFEIRGAAENISAKLGLSLERSSDIARLSKVWAEKDHRTMTNAEQDRFSKELLGFKISDVKKILHSDKSTKSVQKSLEDLVDQAALQNDTSPEQIKNIMEAFL